MSSDPASGARRGCTVQSSPRFRTKAYIGLGDKDRAFTWLTRCVAERSCTLLDVTTEPFSELSSDARYAQITMPLYGKAGPQIAAATTPGQPEPPSSGDKVVTLS